MKNYLNTSIFVVSAFVLTSMINFAYGQTESEQLEIRHVETIEVSYGFNYFSYNFAVYPTQNTIEQIKIEIISDVERKIIEIENEISPPHWRSLGIMIHASDPDTIRYEILEVKIKS